jgi:hypothetical protein
MKTEFFCSLSFPPYPTHPTPLSVHVFVLSHGVSGGVMAPFCASIRAVFRTAILPELSYNLKMLVDMTEVDIHQLDRELRQLKPARGTHSHVLFLL